MFDGWKEHPVTKKLFEFLGKSRQQLMEGWASRQYVNEDKGLSDTANGHAIGMCQAFQDTINITANELTGDDDGE